MEIFEGLLGGFAIAVTPSNILAALLGCLMGTAIGVLPGLGPVAGAALLLPITFSLEPVAGVIMLAGIYYGAQYGGSTTSVLLNIPGEASSVVTAIDGYQMTKKGRGGAALAIMAMGSFVAGTISIILVTMLAGAFAKVGIYFGPVEQFALCLGGLFLLTRMSGGAWVSSLLPAAIGLVAGTVGMDEISGLDRFTFGQTTLSLGINMVPVAVGLFGISEVLRMTSDPESAPTIKKVRLRELIPTKEELRRAVPAWLRGTGIGFFFGLLPGPSATLSSFASYRTEQRFAKGRKELGTGAIEGVAGPEASNNAAATSSIVPVLALGLPFSAALALVMAALMIQGIQPGPLLATQHPEIYWGAIASMYIGNVMLLVLNLPMVGVWVSMLRTPMWVLTPIILMYGVIGAWSVNSNMMEVYILVAFGVLGYFMRMLDFKLAPLIVGLLLGPLIDTNMTMAMFLGKGDLTIFLRSPVAAVIWGIVAIALIAIPLRQIMKRRRGEAVEVLAEEGL